MSLKEIYRPIVDELKAVESLLSSVLKESENSSIISMGNFLLESGGKRIRPSLVILSERAASAGKDIACDNKELVRIAAAMELIHIASLLHDDVLDRAAIRHNRPSVNARWGDDVSIAFGDYIYSKALELIVKSRNPDVFTCIGEAICVMSEGELAQVCQRDNFDLSTESYMRIVRKKTASLFGASCQVGVILGNHDGDVQESLKEFGLNFGMAFQIIDDCRDIICGEEELGKCPGQDVVVGDMTLPLLTLFKDVEGARKEELKGMLESKTYDIDVSRIKSMLVESDVPLKIWEVIWSHINSAKTKLEILVDSDYKQSLNQLVDYISAKPF